MKGVKKCFGLFLALAIIFGSSLSVFLDASAISVPFTQFGLYESYYTLATGCNNYQYQEGYAYYQLINLCSARAFLAETEEVQSTGEYWSASGKVNIVRRRVFRTDGVETNSFVNLHKIDVLNTSHAGTPLTIQSTSVQTFKTKWQISDSEKYETLTVQYNVSGKGALNAYGAFRILIGSPSFAFLWPNETESVTPYSGLIYFENTYETPNVNFSGSFSDGSSATIINQNNTMINQNDQIINQQQQTYDWLTDNSAPSADTSVLGQSAGWLPAGPVDSILTLPVTLAQGIVGVFTGTHTCTPIVLPFSLGPYNESLTIPCMDEYFRIAQISILWNAVGSIIAAFIVYDTLKWLYKFVDDTLTLRENNSGLWGGL